MRVGFVGWRGMVGSVLRQRMGAEGDWTGLQPTFYSTSQVGLPAPDVGVPAPPLADAFTVSALLPNQAILSCQGSAYTERMLPALRQAGWTGHWIDAARAVRMAPSSTIVLDPLNRPLIDQALAAGKTDWIGGNCTVSLMLMALHGLFEADLVEWVTSATYQAASGAGAASMRQLVEQMAAVGAQTAALRADPATSSLALERATAQVLSDRGLPTQHTAGAALAGSLHPWIDAAVGEGRTREEWKAHAEGNKILGRGPDTAVPIDSTCVRVGAMRCHSQAFTIKLRRAVPLTELETLIAGANPWVDLVPNTREATLAGLTPVAVGGSLRIALGRLRTLRMGPEYVSAFTVGDQLLWGAAEPLRRMLGIVRGRV